MNFGKAIEELKKGKKVARAGWSGMFLFLAESVDIETTVDLPATANLELERLAFPSIALKTAQDNFIVGWLASQTDMLAEDWIEVE